MNFDSLAAIASQVTRKTLSSLPPEVAEAVRDVPVFFEPVPGPADLETGISPDTLGLYDPGPDAAPSPKICLWLDNIWEYAGGDLNIFRKELKITLLHEIGHLLGWDEDEIDERGLG